MLAGAILLVREKLGNRKKIVISINAGEKISALSGDSLLITLALAGIHLPAACGGRASCGQCKVIVNRGGGSQLPIERACIGRKEAQAGYRLACALKVRNDLDLNLPPSILDAKHIHCEVVSNRSLSTYLTELTLAVPEEAAMVFQAGDYILVEAPATDISFSNFRISASYRAEWERLNLLHHVIQIPEPTTRAYSLANAPSTNKQLVLVVRIALPPVNAPLDTPPGKVSSYIFSLNTGDRVSVSGPFGNFHASESTREMIYVGGGAGIAPLRSIIVDQLTNGQCTRKMSFWYGSRNLKELAYADEFHALAKRHSNFTYHTALSEAEPTDEWDGHTGLIHSVLFEHYLNSHPNPEEVEYYLCGPPMMSGAVLTMLEDLGVDRQRVFLDDFGTQSLEVQI